MRIEGESGFTIIEIIVAIAIFTILSALTILKLNSFVAHNELEKTAWNLMKDLSGARPTALKNDCRVIIKLQTSNEITIYLDQNNDNSTQVEELHQTITLNTPVSFGLSSTLPSSAPSGATLPSSGAWSAGDWYTNGLTIQNDAVGSINTGSLYLHSSRLSKTVYCICASSTAQHLKMFKWNGSSWNVL